MAGIKWSLALSHHFHIFLANPRSRILSQNPPLALHQHPKVNQWKADLTVTVDSLIRSLANRTGAFSKISKSAISKKSPRTIMFSPSLFSINPLQCESSQNSLCSVLWLVLWCTISFYTSTVSTLSSLLMKKQNFFCLRTRYLQRFRLALRNTPKLTHLQMPAKTPQRIPFWQIHKKLVMPYYPNWAVVTQHS